MELIYNNNFQKITIENQRIKQETTPKFRQQPSEKNKYLMETV